MRNAPITWFNTVTAWLCLIALTSAQEPGKDSGAQKSSKEPIVNSVNFYDEYIDQRVIYSLLESEVQKELELNREQIEAIKSLNQKLSSHYVKLYAKHPELKDSKLDKKQKDEIAAKIEQEFLEARKEIQKEAIDLLVPRQKAVLAHLKFHRSVLYNGFSATVSNPPFLETIKTTATQQAELQKLKAEANAEIKEMFERYQKQLMEKKRAAREKMLRVFSPQQRKKIKELEGKVKPSDLFNL